ncbi:LysR family transcriptional regulator [Mastigocoleus testarum]|uniref:LysR family transcriptional regulator n=1 Tax=Mastigocoleus testarum BC008 TaxID=371196 RepID=A0A0V7ZC56_9CYAN|nr:LysR family transcriptional regulator [Mastigocoleus testarum]KST61894.1 LysR family transcriptional regulator [Mastigocoleus testarum BC008]
MELRQLQYFLAVAEELSFIRAAERLQMAQPPLSRQIRQLEIELGIELFYRTKRRVELTNGGQAFVVEANQILARIEQGIRVAQRASRGEIGQLTIGFEGSSTYDVIPKSLKIYRDRFPQVDLAVFAMTTEEQIEALFKGDIELGFVVSPLNDNRLTIETILSESLVVALPENHPLVTQSEVEVEQLENEAFITFQRNRGCGIYDRIIAVCQNAGFSPRVIQEADEMQVILGFVAAGLGISLLSASVENFHRPGVTYRKLHSSTPKVSLALAWRKENSSVVRQNFIQVVKEF